MLIQHLKQTQAMKLIRTFNRRKLSCFITALSFMLMPAQATLMQGQNQNGGYINGTLLNHSDSSAVSYATVAIYNTPDSVLLTGSTSNNEGEFIIGPLNPLPCGDYLLAISFVGYQPVIQKINPGGRENYDAGTIYLREESVNLDELVITGRRMRAEAESDKTVYFTNKLILDASNTGMDVLKFIPGIHVDFMNNILLDGSRDIIIMVDGIQRDADYLRQLNSGQIDKIEVISSPGPAYDANLTGVLNIILRERQPGLNGHIHAELPANTSEVYIMPAYSLTYGLGKINLFTSYNGDIRRFDITEKSSRTINNGKAVTETSSLINVKQRSWSHRFHYGADYFLNKRNQFNFYGFFNPYSNEHGGDVSISNSGGESGNEHFSGLRKDDDNNLIAFYSLYYKHLFKRPGNEIAIDLSYSDRNSQTTTKYIFDHLPGSITNEFAGTIRPNQRSASLKADVTMQFSGAVKADMGIKGDLHQSSDTHKGYFQHHNNIFAAHGAVSFSKSAITMNSGLRVEHSTTGLKNSFENSRLSVLPGAVINYSLPRNQGVRLTYRRSIYRPDVYQLNPCAVNDDPFSLRRGNPGLVPVLHENIFLDYSIRPGASFISLRLFHNHASQEIGDLTFVDERGLMETRTENLGDIRQYGVQLSGALNINSSISINPYLRLFEVSSSVNDLAGQFDIESRREKAFSAGISAIVSMMNNFTASLILQHEGSRHNIQNTAYSDALYFLSLEKKISQKYKVGIMSGIPFARSFTYHGNKIRGRNFSSHSEGNIMMSAVPVWLKFSYQFSSGREVNTINRSKEQIERRPAKGF